MTTRRPWRLESRTPGTTHWKVSGTFMTRERAVQAAERGAASRWAQRWGYEYRIVCVRREMTAADLGMEEALK